MTSQLLNHVLEPLLEVLSDRVIHNHGQKRIENYSVFAVLHDIFPAKDKTFGAIYNRSNVGRLLTGLSISRELDLGQGISPDIALGDFEAAIPLRDWTQKEWTQFSNYFCDIVEDLKRSDAAAVRDQPENNVPDEENSGLFHKMPEKILRYIKTQHIVCPIRQALMAELDNEELGDEEVPKVDQELVEGLWKDIINERDITVSRLMTRNLFSGPASERTSPRATRSSQKSCPPLRTKKDLRDAFRSKPLKLESVYEHLNDYLQDVCDTLFDEPGLNEVYFPNELVSQLRQTREALGQLGEDPLVDTLRLAEHAIATSTTRDPTPVRARRRSPKRQQEPPTGTTPARPSDSEPRRSRRGSRFYDRNPTATHLEFDDEIEEDNSPEKAPRLTSLPKRAAPTLEEDTDRPRKKKSSQAKQYHGRRKWTNEDKKAILEGIRTFGMGKWATIKDHYIRFEERTSGQIKDCFRTMVRRGEVSQDVLDMDKSNVEEDAPETESTENDATVATV
eukprot:Nitzschia sp. Nitz4//scaffold55_size114948//50444//52230//NITZ4_003898-RA/size114948-snap-gene-0.174-mRNA-1//1//CDS//3329554521//3354//frame0